MVKSCCWSATNKGNPFNNSKWSVSAGRFTFSTQDKRVYYFSFSPVESNGSDWHPDIQTHRSMADELTPFLKKIMHL